MGMCQIHCSETLTFDPKNESLIEDNLKKINLRAEICSSWGYDQDAYEVKQFCKYLAEFGYSVKLKLIPKCGCGGEFYIYKEESLLEKCVFTNNSKKHPGSLFGYSLNKSLYQGLKTKIIGE